MTTQRIWIIMASALALLAPSSPAVAQARPQQIRAEMASVLLQSRRYDEAAREYSVLLAQSPRSYSYRLNYARALLWGRRPRDAEREILILMTQHGRSTELETMLLSARMQMEPSATEAAVWVRERPQTFAYREAYARALARDRRHREALAEYDALIGALGSRLSAESSKPRAESAALYVERARVHADLGDLDAAERDVASSIALGPSAEAYMLAGDIYRWRGNYAAARNAYWAARRRSSEVDLAAAIGRLERDERPVVGLLPDVYGDAPGWRASSATVADNLGVTLTSTTLRRGTWFNGFDASVGATARWFAAPAAGPLPNPGALGLDAAVARDGGRGHWFGRARARVGMLHHPGGGTAPEGDVAAVVYYRAWGAGFALDVGPAYPEMLTLQTFRPSAIGTPQLREQSSTLALAGPVGKLDVAASHQGTALSDGNTRTTLQALARAPVTRVLSVLYAGASMSFTDASPLYWSPLLYQSHSVGPELALRRVRGWSLQARMLPGVAWATERDSTGADVISRAAQVTTSGALTYRGTSWEAGAGAAFGRGRAGDYQRVDVNVFASYTP